MTSIARTGFGIEISFASGFLAEITDVTLPAQSREPIDVSFTAQDDNHRLKMIGELIDSGELQVEIHFDPEADPPIDAAMETVTVTFGSGATWSFSGGLINYEPSAPIDDKMVADVTIAVSGPITISPASTG